MGFHFERSTIQDEDQSEYKFLQMEDLLFHLLLVFLTGDFFVLSPLTSIKILLLLRSQETLNSSMTFDNGGIPLLFYDTFTFYVSYSF